MSGVQIFEHRDSWSETLAAVALFILWGLWLIFNEVPREWALPDWVYFVSTILLLGLITSLPFVVCFSGIKNFPRWSYPYVVSSLLVSLYMMNVATPGFLFYQEIWGWRAWVPLLVVIGILLITRSFNPLRMLIANIFDDWSLLTFGLFGCMPLFIFVYFDEINQLYSLFFMVILTLLMVGTVYIYMQSTTQKIRIRVLLISIFLIIMLIVTGSTIYWLYNGGTNVVVPVAAGVIVYLIMFSPALIKYLHTPRRT